MPSSGRLNIGASSGPCLPLRKPSGVNAAGNSNRVLSEALVSLVHFNSCRALGLRRLTQNLTLVISKRQLLGRRGWYLSGGSTSSPAGREEARDDEG